MADARIRRPPTRRQRRGQLVFAKSARERPTRGRAIGRARQPGARARQATPGHLWHESAAWNVAVGAAFLFIALRRNRPSGLVPMLTAFVGMLAPGATAVIDDLTPGRSAHDPVRELWLGHPDLAATELQVSPREAVIVAVRVL